MLKNYILVALRNIRKHKYFAAVNIIGLSLSMSVCLVLILLVYDHLSYDSFHPNRDRIYRITTFGDGQIGPFDEEYATSPMPLKKELLNNYAFVAAATNLNNRFRGEIRSVHKILEISSLYADKHFFDVFGFQLLEGSSSGMAEPYNILLSESMASKLFPDGDAISQTVDFEDHGAYKVIGIVQDPPGNTHIKFDALASYATLPVLAEKEIITGRFEEWDNIYSNYNYLVLSDAEFQSEAERIINELSATNMELPEDHSGYEHRLQPIGDVVPGKIMSNEISFAFPWFVLVFFVILGVVVIITATINYANLSIAKSLSRTKEIGIRKVNGASRKQLVLQFLIESIMIALLSLIVAVFIYKLLIGAFNEIYIFSLIGIELQDSWAAYIYFFLFTILLGAITGIGPSLFISKLDAVKSLKGSLTGLRSRRNKFISLIAGKRTLLGVQFSLSLIMLVSILILREQANYLVEAEYGFDDDQVFLFNCRATTIEL